MDKLDELLKRQSRLDEYIAVKRGLDFDKQEWIRRKCSAMICETCELMDEVNYKWWKAEKRDNENSVKEEIVDVLHFFLGICNDAGISGDELYRLYMDKNRENYDRQDGKSDKKGYEINE